MTVTSLTFSSSSRARFQPTLPAPAMITYTPRSRPRVARAADRGLGLAQGGALELVDRDRRRADGLQALLGVPGRAARVQDARDDLRHLEALVGDLRDHQVGVVAVGGRDEDVRLGDAGLLERLHLQRRPDREAPAGGLPGLAELDVEALVRQRVLVEDRDGVPGP